MSGPRLEIVMTCVGCEYLHEKTHTQKIHFSWEVPLKVTTRDCTHPSHTNRHLNSERTPETCPLLPDARAKFISNLKGGSDA